MFNENILETMIKTKLGLKNLKIELEDKFRKFSIQII